MLRVRGTVIFFSALSNSLTESKCENRPKHYVAQMTSNHAKSGQKPINSNLKQHRLKVSHFDLELFRTCSNFSGICFIPIQTLTFCRFDNICGTWNKLKYALHALHAPFAWAVCVETLAYGPCLHSFSRSPKLPLVLSLTTSWKHKKFTVLGQKVLYFEKPANLSLALSGLVR